MILYQNQILYVLYSTEKIFIHEVKVLRWGPQKEICMIFNLIQVSVRTIFMTKRL